MKDLNNKIPQNYKQTKVGIIPKDWEVKRLKNQVYVDKDNLSLSFNNKFINYVSLSDISNGKVYPNRIEFNSAPSRARRIAEKGSVLLATVRPNLKNFAYVDKDNIIASTGFAVLSKKKMDQKYLYNFLYSEIAEKQYFTLTVGSNYPALNSNDVKNIRIPIPPLPEQKVIADCLTTWDKGIEKLTALIQSKKEQKKGLMQGLFNGQLKVENRRLIQAKEGEDFSKDWEEFRLGDVLKIGSGKDFKHLDSGTIPVFGSGGLMLKVNDYLYDGDSVGIGRKGTIDKPVFLTGKFWTVDTLFYTHSFKNTIPKFIYYNFLKINWYKYNEASGVPSLSKKTIEGIIINMPSVKEQTEIVEVLSLADKEIDLLNQKLEAIQSQKKGLMQVLLTGQKRLVAND